MLGRVSKLVESKILLGFVLLYAILVWLWFKKIANLTDFGLL